jgi:hypothetical protein
MPAAACRLVEARGGSVRADYRDGRFQLWFTLPAGDGRASETV